MKKKKMKKEYIVFGIIMIVSAIVVLSTSRIGIHKYYYDSEDKLQILFLGDSNIAYDFGDKSIPQRIAERIDCEIYNCAVGGTTACKINTENYIDKTIDSLCLYYLSRIMELENHQTLYDFYEDVSLNEKDAIDSMYMLGTIENEAVDYIVISYGLNDYVSGRPVYGSNPRDEMTYAGALRCSIERIQKMFPNAKIILSSITYCVFYEDGEVVADGYDKDFGGGTIVAYRDAAQQVASEYDDVYFMNNLELLQIDKANYMDYIRDDLHLNAHGQEEYADNFVEIIQEIESGADE